MGRCLNCDGTGKVEGDLAEETCPMCEGSGDVPDDGSDHG